MIRFEYRVSPKSEKKNDEFVCFSLNNLTTCIRAAELGVGLIHLPQFLGQKLENLVELPRLTQANSMTSIYMASPIASRKLNHVDYVWNQVLNIFQP